jgi:hypothetical protein
LKENGGYVPGIRPGRPTALALAWFVFGLKTGWSIEEKSASKKLRYAEAEEELQQ